MKHIRPTRTHLEMILGKALPICFACGVTLAAAFDAIPHAEALEGCREPKAGTSEAPIVSPPVSVKVMGVGRLQFYSAPNFRCSMGRVFVVPKDELIEYAARDDGWSSVVYDNFKAKSGIVRGWVRSGRLKVMWPVGPKQ